MTRKVIAVLLLSGLLASNASAFKIPGADKVLPSGAASFDTSSIKTQIKELEATSLLTTQSYNEAIVALASTISTKEQVAELKAKQKALTAEASAAEKNIIAGPVVQDSLSMIQTAAQDKELSAKLQGLNATQKETLANAGWNVALAGLGMATVGKGAKDLVNQVSADPAAAVGAASELKALKNIVSNSATQAKQMGTTLKSVYTILKAAGVKVKEPKSATEKAVAVDPWAN